MANTVGQCLAAEPARTKLILWATLYRAVRAEVQWQESSKDSAWKSYLISLRNLAWYELVTEGQRLLAMEALIPSTPAASSEGYLLLVGSKVEKIA